MSDLEQPPSNPPTGLDVDRHRDWQGRGLEIWFKRGLTVLLTLFVLAALLNVFGQRTVSAATTANGTTMTVSTPERLRLGLIFQTRVDITTSTALKHPELVLGSGWFNGVTLNSTEPGAAAENPRGSGVGFTYPALPAGGHMSIFMEWSANPTHPAWSRAQTIQLFDGGKLVVEKTFHVTVFP